MSPNRAACSAWCAARSSGVRGSADTVRKSSDCSQERGCLARQHAGLIDANDFDRAAAVRRGNARIDPHTRVVGVPVELDAKPFKAAQDPAADLRGVLTDAAPESDHIDPAELAHIRRHVVPGTPTEYLDRKLGTRISAALEREQLAHVGAAAGEAEQTTVGIQLAAHFRRRQAAALHDVKKRAGIHVPGARTHDQTLEWRESNAGRHRAPIESGGDRTAASKLQTDDPAGGPAGRYARARRLAQVPVRGAMKPVASH